MKKIILFFLFVLGLVFSVVDFSSVGSLVFAQAPQYGCLWTETVPGLGLCQPVPPYCSDDWHEPEACANKDSGECDGSYDCDPDPTPVPPTPVPPGGDCSCSFNGMTCLDQTPSTCSSDYQCVCGVVWEAIGPVGCEQGTCEIIPTLIPTPTGGAQHGSCGAYDDPFLGCQAGYPNECDDGYRPVASADCSFCTCEPNPIYISGNLQGDCPDEHIDTALGCVPVRGSGFTPWLVGRGIMIAGGVAFLLMVFGGIQVMLSSGNPEGIMAGKSLITAAISGLLLIIFAIFLLRLIGVEILGIPNL